MTQIEHSMSIHDLDDFSARVSYAASVIAHNEVITRAFDTCFEMYDGAAIAAALVRRSWSNQKLAQNLPRYMGTDAIERATAKAHAFEDLSLWARELRTSAQDVQP